MACMNVCMIYLCHGIVRLFSEALKQNVSVDDKNHWFVKLHWCFYRYEGVTICVLCLFVWRKKNKLKTRLLCNMIRFRVGGFCALFIK